LCAHHLVDRGLLDLERPVAHYWPEFAAADKGSVTVAQVLSHQAGLAAIDRPTLVVVGAEDQGTPVSMAEQIADAIPGARLEIVEEAAHLSNIERADRFNELLLRFLDANC